MIKRYLYNLLHFASDFRRSGTTTLLKKIAEKEDVWIIVFKSDEKKQFGEKAITLFELENSNGLDKKPFLLDNNTIMQLSDLSLNEIKNLQRQIDIRNNLIRKIRRDISEFERLNGKI